MADHEAYATSISSRLRSQITRRHVNIDALIEGPLVHLDDAELEEDIRNFAPSLPGVNPRDILRAALVAREIRAYTDESLQAGLPIHLTEEERKALKEEKEKTFSQSGLKVVVTSVALAALLQGSVQASINAGSIFATVLDLPPSTQEWRLGGMNAAPYLAAAVLGAPLSLPLNYWMGRRGAIAVAACLIFASSLASAFAKTWYQLLGIRIVNGVGMGIKAISTPILASETAVDQWRGSSVLMWQLWVAFGIMMGNVVNLILVAAAGALDFPVRLSEGQNPQLDQGPKGKLALQLILAAPMVPALLTLVALSYCMESPRFYMQKNTPNYRPQRAYEILSKVRNTQLQALRDIYLIHKNIELEDDDDDLEQSKAPAHNRKRGLTFASHLSFALSDTFRQYSHLLKTPRLRNAVWSTCTVALAQQLCGINVFAFYSNDFFIRKESTPRIALLYSIGFVFAAVYSPGLGPIPFTLASESFPLSQRESGCSVAISVNLFFAGVFTIVFPSINSELGPAGALALFSGLNVVAFILVFLIVEETKQISLEELSLIYAVPKTKFMTYQLTKYLPYLWKRYITRSWGDREPPNFYTTVVEPYVYELRDLGGESTTNE
ncbi:hypothetical protein CkaCkLH20_02246 [Colletotrichum karsti]|uniref:Major facilitator superfamily (MFS) profile domain-containing protein n=1 Tax=Colletotrichum karsti TaxID=1095194 RepID=A0A9P6LQ37_9PEZI|nr:uncharacterized protein CkaCkLH20_02246 [Colletotrichum karsti]KAF9880292.1 hypothetical protein CkaCkLH20_02246 [Colletotrichum karsti]